MFQSANKPPTVMDTTFTRKPDFGNAICAGKFKRSNCNLTYGLRCGKQSKLCLPVTGITNEQ